MFLREPVKQRLCFNLMANIIEAYKIRLLSEQSEGHRVTDIDIELALYLVERAQAWVRLEHDERVHHRSD